MRGEDELQEGLFSFSKLEDFVPADHPLRPMKDLVNESLKRLNGLFNTIYADTGRASVAPEKLMRALLLQVFFSVRSERQLMEQIRYNMLFRWFIGLAIDDPVWDHSVFSKNRDRLLEHEVVDAREVECAVLGGFDPRASVLGEIRFASEFYDYEAKYAAESTQLLIPADVSPAQSDEMRALALRAFRALKCWGMARVDFFLERSTGRPYLNELNTLPGFTDGSMYPKLWEASGIALPELVDRLIEHALERGREAASLEIKFKS